MKEKNIFGKRYRKLRKETERELKGEITIFKPELICLTVVCLCPLLDLLFTILTGDQGKGLLIPALLSLLTISIAVAFWSVYVIRVKKNKQK